MMEAARVACIDAFLESREGLDTVIDQMGANLSGGQKQRMSIARAVCKRPEIFLFDDTFSALDFKTDAQVRKNLRKATKDATMLIVSQRINTIADADRIIVLTAGEVTGDGAPDEIMPTLLGERVCPAIEQKFE